MHVQRACLGFIDPNFVLELTIVLKILSRLTFVIVAYSISEVRKEIAIRILLFRDFLI